MSRLYSPAILDGLFSLIRVASSRQNFGLAACDAFVNLLTLVAHSLG